MGKKYDHWCDNQHQEPSEDREEYRLKKYTELGKDIDGQFKSWIGSFGHHMTKWEIDKIYALKDEVAKCRTQ